MSNLKDAVGLCVPYGRANSQYETEFEPANGTAWGYFNPKGISCYSLGLLKDLAGKEPEKYGKFWKEFGRVLKEGVGEDFANRERIARLLRFSSTHADSEEQTVSLADYILRMKEGQDTIYYVTAEAFLAAKNSPHLEVFRKRGIEVLLLSDRVDEWLVANLHEYEGKQLASVAKGELDLSKFQTEEEKKEEHKLAGEHRALVARLKDALGDRVKDVRVSSRLTQSPSCLVADEHDMGGNLARILKAVVVFVSMHRVRRGYYTMRVSVLAEPPYDRGAGTEVIERYVRALEAEIRESPADWLWIHRKWKYPKPADA